MVYLDIISGFLGAGKTTFANLLLDFYIKSGERPVYIVNEYGEAGLDAQIMRTEGFEAVEMTNGCICCTLKSGVTRAIADIIGQFHPTRVVFEPSGIFMFNNFFDILEGKDLKGKCAVGNIVTVIDGLHYNPARLVFGNFIYDQIQSAPVLFVSKLDKAPADLDLTEMLCDVRNVNPNATIVTNTYDELTPELMAELFLEKSDLYGHGEQCGCASCGHSHDYHSHDEHSHGHDHHGHGMHEAFDVLTVEVARQFDGAGLEAFIGDIENGVYGNVVRAKGIVFLDGKARLLNVTFGEAEHKPWPCYDTPAMTFIGKGLNKEKVTGLEKA